MQHLDLTIDHLIPASLGGANGPVRVLCRSCNGRRGATR
jgi:5-methylcytosine-specific restriction endonuclease McrA